MGAGRERTVSEEQESDVTDEDWQERAAKIRAVENEDGTLPAIVTGWTIRDDDTAVVSYEVRGVSEEETMTLDASITPGEESEFERFLANVGGGYTLETADSIADDTPVVPVVEKRGSWKIAERLHEETESDDTGSGLTPSIVARGIFWGLAVVFLPVLGWLTYAAAMVSFLTESDYPGDEDDEEERLVDRIALFVSTALFSAILTLLPVLYVLGV